MSHKKLARKSPQIGLRLFCAALATMPVPASAQILVPAPNQKGEFQLAHFQPGQPQDGRGEDQGLPQGAFGGQPPVSGMVTAVAADRATIKTPAGEIYQVFLGPNTRLMRDRQPIKPSEIQVGDLLSAMGEADAPAKTVHAALAFDISAEQVKKMRDGLGKQWIAGRVAAIEDTTITIHRIDNVTQKIEVDETTSFRRNRGREGMGGVGAAAGAQGAPPADAAASGDSITLADIKVGDNVTGRGGMKGDVFVPTVLAVRAPSPGGGRRRANSGEPPAPGASAPAAAARQ